MKYFNMFMVIVLACICFGVSSAKSAEVEVQVRQDMYSCENLDSSVGVVVKALSDTGIYVWGGYSSPKLIWGGQNTAEIDLYSGGLGFKYKFNNVLGFIKPSTYIHVGYYYPEYNMWDRSSPEGLMYYYESKLPSLHHIHWKNWIYNLDPNFGGEIGLNLDAPITEWFSIGLTASYRFLELHQEVIRSPKPYKGNYSQKHHELYEDVDFGGPSVSVNAIINF